MRKLLRFINVYHFFLLFLLIESFSLFLYVSHHKFQKSKIQEITHAVSGFIYTNISTLNEYLYLKEENQYLREENSMLKSLLDNQLKIKKINHESFSYIPARIINNSIFRYNNFILLNKGEKDGVKENMGIITQNGVIGIVKSISNNYSQAISVLNTKSSISIKHYKSNQNGSMSWNGLDYMHAQINDIPNHTPISIGDTIKTNGFSSIFPSEIDIGTITSFNKETGNGFYNIKMRFINDMNSITNVYIIKDLNKAEKERL